MTDNPKIIRGAGGPPPPPKPFRAPDTLHSRQFATVQDLISEGEIEGFSSPSKAGITDKTSDDYNNAALKDVFLNDTPVLNADASNSSPASGDFNFQDVTFKFKEGTSNQTKLSGIPTETRRPVAVSSADVTTSAPVIKQLTDSSVDAVIVTLTWAQIQRSEDNGDIHGSTVQYKISVQASGGSYVERVNTSVVGRTADSYSRDHRLKMVDANETPLNFPVNIKVERVTADADPAGFLRDEFKFSFVQEVIDNDSTYANSAYTALRLDSKIFNSVPARTFRIRGIKVRIPGAGANSSGTPTVVANQTIANSLGLGTPSSFGFIHYPDGYIFNGTMQAAVWTTCPAFILLDLLITKRYGLGDHIASDQTNDSTTFSNVDLFSFFAASKYANKLVDDGKNSGTKEARFSCNVNIQSPKEAFAAINELSGVMRCMPIWSAGTINISQDSPTNASYLFNLANVGEAGFNYQGSSLKQRHSVISVSYFNMDSREIDFEVYEDATAISKLGTIVKQVKAFACTSRNQAKRLARAILFAEQNESETVTFTTSIDSGMLVRPGTVIEINDPVRSGARRGGRVVSATTSAITIDGEAQTTLPSLTDSPTISVILPDGTVESRSITGISGAVITVGSVFSAVPNTNSPYLISSTTLSTQLFRVIQVTEEDDINYAITALTYVEGKYAFIEDGTALPVRNVSLLNNPINAPSNLTSAETTVVINGIARSRLLISWKEPTKTFFADDGSVYESPQGASSYQLNYRITSEAGNTDNFITQEVFSNDFEIMDTTKGSVEVEISAYNASGKLSTTALTGTIQTTGKSGAPDNVTNLTIEPINEQFIRLRFTQSTSVDVLHGGRVYVRHSNLAAASATFQTAQDIIEAVAGNSNEAICPALAGTYLLKFQDDTGNFSTTVAKVSLSLVDILDSITVKTDREDNDTPPFNNTTSSLFSNTEYNVSKGGLILTNPVNNATGTYDFVDTLDLGSTFSLVLKRHFQGVGFYTGDLFDNRTDDIDTWVNFDGTEAPDANAKLAVRTSTDMSAYSDFNDFANGTFKGRGFQFRATLNTSDTAQNINLQQLGYSATLPSRTEQSSVIASGAGAKAVTFTAPFFVGTSGLGNLNSFLPSVNISPQNMATGDYFELSSISGTGFTVHFKNSSNASIDRNFTYSAVGFGKGG